MKKKKILALILAMTLVAACAVAGTLAWLTAKSDTVTNTFTTSGIEVTLTETTGSDYKMVPGYEIAKDPKATVLAGSEECYLFVKLEKSANFDSFLTYGMADGWTALDGAAGVYYREVASADIGTAYSVLADDKVAVKGTVSADMMEGLTAATYPTLTVSAYASQLYKRAGVKFTPAEAWANVAP